MPRESIFAKGRPKRDSLPAGHQSRGGVISELGISLPASAGVGSCGVNSCRVGSWWSAVAIGGPIKCVIARPDPQTFLKLF